ncbi:MAG: 2-C-methyl-D-erythritol 4-phosphate cytidylyltransferase [Chthoniobacterales bacterium]
MLSAIIVAAGSSQRMGFDKLFALLNDKPVVGHTLSAFENADCVNEIIVVGRSDRVGELEDLVRQSAFRKVVQVIAGGEQRQDSVRQGLERVGPGAAYVAVHDAARPLVTQEQITKVFNAAREHGGAALAEPVTDTLKCADEKGLVTGGVPREGLFAMQTPQIFRRDLLWAAYQTVTAKNLTVTDEVSAVQHHGGKVVVVPNDDWNIKITYPRDLFLAQSALSRRSG